MKFGRLTVIERVEDYTYIVKSTGKINRCPRWLCKCDCGNDSIVLGRRLRDETKSCGCLQREYASTFEDLSGQKFGKLTVIKYSHRTKNIQSKIYWECKCDCGNVDYVSSDNLRSGVVKSCGCERLANFNSITQDKSGTRLYGIYKGMKIRCNNPNNKAYKYYGGKGVCICEEWLSDPVNFYNWAMNNGYDKELTIDRINCAGNYEPSNCRWTTTTEQNNNTTRNININFGEEKLTMSELCIKLNISYTNFVYHIRRKKENIKDYLLNIGCDVDALSIQIL